MPFLFPVLGPFVFSFETRLQERLNSPGQKTKYPKNITTALNPFFEQFIGSLYMFKIGLRDSFNNFN